MTRQELIDAFRNLAELNNDPSSNYDLWEIFKVVVWVLVAIGLLVFDEE